MSGPRISSGSESKQDYTTPACFIAAVEERFGPICFDLAAHAGNTKHARWYGPDGEAEDSLTQPWRDLAGLLWLNPPFAEIAPWARKCASESARGAQIALLVPASVGSNWFHDHVAPFADTYLLNGRLSFDGKGLYPKDCLLAHYHGAAPSICIWDWRYDAVASPWGGDRVNTTPGAAVELPIIYKEAR